MSLGHGDLHDNFEHWKFVSACRFVTFPFFEFHLHIADCLAPFRFQSKQATKTNAETIDEVPSSGVFSPCADADMQKSRCKR